MTKNKHKHMQKCVVCNNEVGTAHKCDICKNNVHLICGTGVGDEEYGQFVVCFNCERKKRKKKVPCTLMFFIVLLVNVRL